MKIICEVSVLNRLAPNVKGRFQQSTVALGTHPPGSKEPDDLFIIHFTAANKNGTRYKIKRNIEQIFTKFVQDGKTTISFKQPSHNLQMRCDPVQLKCFLQTLKLAMEGKFEPQKIGLSSLAVTGVPRASMPVKKMTILRPSEYPVKGLPRTLTWLAINGLRKHSIEPQVLNLVNLTVLQLNNNCISRIPKRLGDMALVDLDLSQNSLGASRANLDWDWTEGRIQSSLQNLNLNDNKLLYFPYKIVKLTKLHTLKLSNNQIQRVPFAIRRMQKLRDFNISHNQIGSLPSTISRMSIKSLDVSGEKMFAVTLSRNQVAQQVELGERQPTQLWLLAAHSVISNRIPVSPRTVPWDILELIEEAPFCECGRLCLISHFSPRTGMIPLTFASIQTSAPGMIYKDSVYCNDYCKSKFYKYFYQ